MFARWWAYPLMLVFFMAAAGSLVLGFAAVLLYPGLPTLEALTDYQPKIPLRIYSIEGQLIGEFGEERRAVVALATVPKSLIDAIVAAEDERFFRHRGVDYVGVARAALSNFSSGGARQGASTITMQVARNFFLSKEKTLGRKFNEMLLAFKIEAMLTKQQILELYINQIYLGQRAYGFAAAAQIYYGKSLSELGVAEHAMLAGLPKAPSRFNPVANPARAKLRQQYVLRRMRELNMITPEQQASADHDLKPVRQALNEFTVRANYFAEMIRAQMVERFGEEAYTRGYSVHTTLRAEHQQAAYAALRKGVMDYDQRHGYRGPETYVDLSGEINDERLEDALQEVVDSDELHAAVVLEASPQKVKLYRAGGERITIGGEGLKFVARMLNDQVAPNQRVRRGAVVRLIRDSKGQWQIAQLPQVEAAFVSADPRTGAIRALVGGFDFNRSQFNHVTQALRQAGSSFKPFIYSASLEKGFTAASVINDAPLTFSASQTGSESWEPKNFDGKFEGPMRMRTALAKSKNLVSVRILQSITPQYAQDYIGRFGFDPKMHPPYLTMALGAGNVTPLQMLGAYSIFANGGYKVTPYFIDRVVDNKGRVVMATEPQVAGDSAEPAIDPRNAFIMSSLMRDVVRMGTAARAMRLNRNDLAGKTGTTNDFIDAWFCGFQPNLVAVAWMGYDQPKTLGRNETGGSAALPIWIDYMSVALRNVPEEPFVPPSGIAVMQINPNTGVHVTSGGISEYFYQEFPATELDSEASPSEEKAATTEKR
jgi:penicillin-binding protein 1A